MARGPNVKEVLIEHDGRPFDPLKGSLKGIEKNLATAKPGGRGVCIVRNMTSAMSYMRAGEWNRVQLVIARHQTSIGDGRSDYC